MAKTKSINNADGNAHQHTKASSIIARYLSGSPDVKLEDLVMDEDKTTSVLIKTMMKDSDTGEETVARYLDCKLQSLRNKFSRNSFSIDDLLIIAYACDFTVLLQNNKTGVIKPIDIVNYFKPLHEDVLVRFTEIERLTRQQKEEEYHQLKAKLQEMQDRYGFDS